MSSGGLVLEAGSSAGYETGSWRTFRPVINPGRCNCCLNCWAYCPDGAILVRDGEVPDVDLKHCKGCGICSRECPQQAIAMEVGV